MFRKNLRWLAYLSIGFLVALLLLDTAFPFRFRIPYAAVVVDTQQAPIHTFLSSDDKWRFRTSLNEISPWLQKAIIAKEDRYFYWHFGINPIAIGRAILGNASASKTTSGASTITMQVARLLRPKSRTYVNKLIEAFHALQLEWHYSKEEILALYLNLVPYGGNIEGVGAASLLYFNTHPKQLSLAQAVTLSVIPNRPTTLALGKYNNRIVLARNKWLKRFEKEGVFEPAIIQQSLTEPLEASRQPSPKLAPQFSYWLRSQYPNSDSIYSTLQLPLQYKVQQMLSEYVKRWQAYQIHNGAVLIIDNHHQQIVAYAGSPDFADSEHGGQIDAVQAIRSPGSTLKPLLYALAFDQGLYTPKSVIEDIPQDFDGYQPENFDREFRGKVNVASALAHSLNLTAVKTLDKLGMQSFIASLEQAQMHAIVKQQDRLGLSLALGGCGTSLYELAGLYSIWANKGCFRPLQALQNPTKPSDCIQVISPEAAYMTTEILTQLQRPDFPHHYQYAKNLPKVAWKTGTSYGRHDAWSIGFNPRYTVAVWLGNVNGRSAEKLIGGELATPLLLDIFRAIDTETTGKWFSRPDNLEKREVCRETGLPPSSFCTETVNDDYIPLVSPMAQCEHLKSYFIDEQAQISYCGSCLPPQGFSKKLYANLSPSLNAFYHGNGYAMDSLAPPHNPNCTLIAQHKPPKITSPAHHRQYLRIDGEEVQLSLQCEVASDIHEVYWYVDGRFVQKSPAHEAITASFPIGRHYIACTDDRGQSNRIEIVVK